MVEELWKYKNVVLNLGGLGGRIFVEYIHDPVVPLLRRRALSRYEMDPKGAQLVDDAR